ncbi:MAG TPA: c-type cytochrome [Thermoanaerobaculia bacterium]|nr:c-type cytochrome [Thermoanaerobaculia bacterium]
MSDAPKDTSSGPESGRAEDPEKDAEKGAEKGLKHRLLVLGAALAVILGIATLAGVAGLAPVRASSEHWPVTRWLLDFSMGRAVSTQSLGIREPPLDDPEMVRRGAAHYQIACLACHGGPGEPRQQVPMAMTPRPPYVPVEVERWRPRELFFIVRHGIKLTAMPAWPADGRDDEVWSMVAFLLELPELDAERYRALAFGEATEEGTDEGTIEGGQEVTLSFAPPEGLDASLVSLCSRCHGSGGRGREGVAPRLAGQRAEYLYHSLSAYATGERPSGTMTMVAAELSVDDARRLTAYYAGLPPPRTSVAGAAPAAEASERGSEIAHLGLPHQKVPSCADCHGPGDGPRNPRYPRLAGQDAEYLERQLHLFKAGVRGGTQYARIMNEVASGLEPEQMREVSQYYAAIGE